MLTLVAVLAWPWGVALATLDTTPASSSAADPVVRTTTRGEPGPSVLSGRRGLSADSPALAPVDEEEGEEGDDAGPPPSGPWLAEAAATFGVGHVCVRTPGRRRVALDCSSARFCRFRC